MMPNTIGYRNGLQVGYYIAYSTFGEVHQGARVGKYTPLPWGVCHWPSDTVVLSVPTFDEALVLADDLSLRYSTDVPDRVVFTQGVPTDVYAWLMHVMKLVLDSKELIGFRRWQNELENSPTLSYDN